MEENTNLTAKDVVVLAVVGGAALFGVYQISKISAAWAYEGYVALKAKKFKKN